MALKLNKTNIEKITATGKWSEYTDSEVPGFKLRVSPSGGKAFYLYYRGSDNKKRKFKIEDYTGAASVARARKAAEKHRAGIVHESKDPLAEKKQNRERAKVEKVSKLRNFLDHSYYPFAEQHQKSPYRTKQILETNFGWLMQKPMSKITAWEIEKWRSDRKKQGVKPATINRAITALKAVLNKAVQWEILQANPIAKVKRLKVETRGIVRYLSIQEDQRLSKALSKRNGRLPVIVTLLLNTGARPNEIFTLKWRNVDLAGRRITLHAAFTKTNTTRYVPLNSVALETLKEWRQQNPNATWVFENDGAPITTIQKGWNKLLEDAKIEHFRLYDCRHTFASKLVMAGVSVYEVAELLGHSSVEMTRIYAHLSPEHLQSAVERLA